MMSLASSEGKDNKNKVGQWIQLFKYNRTMQSTDIKLSLAQQKPQENPQNKFYCLKFKHIGNLSIPKISQDQQAKQQEVFYSVQVNVTLYNPKTGFFGRTYKGKQIPLKKDDQKQELTMQNTDWAIFYTQSEAVETKAITEVIMISIDKNQKKRVFGIGYSVIPLFIPELPLSADILKGTPRDIVKFNDPNYVPQKVGSTIYFDFKSIEKKLDPLMSFLPDNCLFGENDELPGVLGSHLPSNLDSKDDYKLVKMQTIYAHNIRISSMNELEACFLQFIKNWAKYNISDLLGSNAEVQERKLTVVPHNSWRQIGSQSFVSLGKEINGVVQSSGAIKILNFPLHPQIALIFKLEYRVQYINESGKQEIKDFVLGWCYHVPQLTNMNENIKDQEIQFDLMLGPDVTLLGDILWDPRVIQKQKKLYVKMGLILTSSEDMISEIEKKRQEEILLKEAQAKVKNQMQSQEEEKKKEQEKLRQIQEENKKLKKEKQELEQINQKPSEELIIKETVEKQEIVQAKEYYTNKNEEIELLIQQILKNQNSGTQSLPQQLAGQSESNIASLLRYLIQLVLSNYGPDAQQMTSEARQEMTKKNLMELLKGDQNYKMNVFGSQGGMSMLESKELSRQDKINLIKLGIGKNLLDAETEAKLIATEPRMDIEVQDQYKASTITFKFVAFKTPFTFNTSQQFPSKLFFTFKFFTFKSIESEKVLLRLPPEIEHQQQQVNNQSQLNAMDKIKLNNQYYLVRLNALQQQESYQAETNLQIIFDIDPSISKIEDENLHLSRYLKDKILTIDLWNGDSLMHFGTCKVALNKIMRQGEPSKVIGQEYDVCEPEQGTNVGGLQLLITNQGRRIQMEDENFNKTNMSNSPLKMTGGKIQPSQSYSKHKKKVLSKPIDNLSSTGDLTSLAQAYEFQKQSTNQTYQSEEARKKLRVERLKRMTVGNEISLNTINDPKANEWQKFQSLKQIEMLRESKKSQLLTTVLKESMQFKQTINVSPGEVELIQFLVSNPFPQDELFQVVISDPDETVLVQPEIQLVHNEKHEWQFWFNQGKCAKPIDWDLVSNKQDLLLSSGQQCPLLLKFISFREPVIEANHKKQQGNSPYEIKPRKIKITVISKDKMPISTMEVKINPREQYCDQTFRYYEPQNIKSYIKIPQYLPFNMIGMNIFSSNKEMKADINQNGEMYIVLQTNRAPSKSEGYLYLYQDQYQSQLLACCKVEVYSLTCIRQKVQAGPDITYQLQVRSQAKRTIEIYSSNTRLVFPPGQKERNLQVLQPNEQTSILIGVKANVAGVQRARIHCVDINTKELIQAWLFEIEADKPQLNKAYQIELVAGRYQPYKFQYVNPLSEFVTVEIVSSKPNIMQVKREKQSFEANERKDIDLFFPPQNKAQQFETILYINDQSGKINESLLFKIIVKE